MVAKKLRSMFDFFIKNKCIGFDRASIKGIRRKRGKRNGIIIRDSTKTTYSKNERHKAI
uniref:Uncharacterized protein n=1 Tax=uncultured marine virus TaxID=186617 RepID=A0A0F7L4W4_9VIRU|nr:hypothetical protein [uncultured marine virus]